MGRVVRKPLHGFSRIALAVATFAVSAFAAPPAVALDETSDQQKRGSIVVSYEAPRDASVQNAYDMATGAKALEMLRVIFSPFRLSEDLHLKTVNCDGIANAYFFREDGKPTIRICYEYLQSVYGMIPKETTPEGITPREAFTGQLLFAVAHEFGHAAFDIYDVPVLGRLEDAADQFATYFLLQFGGELAHHLIRGAAYAYYDFVSHRKDRPKVTLPIVAFSSDHGAPEQRFYNLVCIAYGWDPKIFAAVVEKGYLPEARARVCKYEYSNLAYAMNKLVGPHIDEGQAEKAAATTATWSAAPFWRKPGG